MHVENRESGPMHCRWKMLAPSLLLITLLAACHGCSSDTPDSKPPSSSLKPGGLPASTMDIANRYPSAVMVRPYDPMSAEEAEACSGVLIAPRLVLTAGQCVCLARAPEASQDTTPVDRSACAREALVTTVAYEASEKVEGAARSRTQVFKGTVRLHPEFRLVPGSSRSIASSHANLAAVLLHASVEGAFPAASLGESEVRDGEPLVVVGYGSDERQGGAHGTRRSSEHKVEQAVKAGGEEFRLERSGHYQVDSGSPCFRESPKGALLVGISIGDPSSAPTFTSTSVYRDWLRAELQHAARQAPDAP